MSIGTFTLIKNENDFIRDHIGNVSPYLDHMVFFDGNSTDGTLGILRYFTSRFRKNMTLVEEKDPLNLEDDYVRLFNECMRTLKTDWAWFLHPDMYVENPELIPKAGECEGVAQSVKMFSYAGEPGGKLYRIEEGRSNSWKNIYRLNNPDLGAHYHGWYGSASEDVYFSAITGKEHNHHSSDYKHYSYDVDDSGLIVHHFSDVRTYDRRLSRMIKCLVNQGYDKEQAKGKALIHPRVTLKNGDGFKFVECKDPRNKTTEVSK